MNNTLNKSNICTDLKNNYLVFLKVKGHKPWPTEIVNIDRKTYKNITKYDVKLFGTHKCDLCLFDGNKQRDFHLNQ